MEIGHSIGSAITNAARTKPKERHLPTSPPPCGRRDTDRPKGVLPHFPSHLPDVIRIGRLPGYEPQAPKVLPRDHGPGSALIDALERYIAEKAE